MCRAAAASFDILARRRSSDWPGLLENSVFEADDFGEAFPAELREPEERIRAKAAKQRS